MSRVAVARLGVRALSTEAAPAAAYANLRSQYRAALSDSRKRFGKEYTDATLKQAR